MALGFDAVCTGHHARIENGKLVRSVDAARTSPTCWPS